MAAICVIVGWSKTLWSCLPLQ